MQRWTIESKYLQKYKHSNINIQSVWFWSAQFLDSEDMLHSQFDTLKKFAVFVALHINVAAHWSGWKFEIAIFFIENVGKKQFEDILVRIKVKWIKMKLNDNWYGNYNVVCPPYMVKQKLERKQSTSLIIWSKWLINDHPKLMAVFAGFIQKISVVKFKKSNHNHFCLIKRWIQRKSKEFRWNAMLHATEINLTVIICINNVKLVPQSTERKTMKKVSCKLAQIYA